MITSNELLLFGRSNNPCFLSAIMSARDYSAIVMDIRKAINFYSYNNRASNLTDVWCAGEGGTVTALQEAIAQSTGMSIHHIEELLPQASEDARELSLFAAAIGAAMQ